MSDEIELERVFLRINITLDRLMTVLHELLVLQIQQDAAEFLLEALNSIFLALLELELGVSAIVNFLLILQLGLLLSVGTLRVQIVKLLDAALGFSWCGSHRLMLLGPAYRAPLVNLCGRRRLLQLILLLSNLSQLLFALCV